MINVSMHCWGYMITILEILKIFTETNQRKGTFHDEIESKTEKHCVKVNAV